MAPLADSLAAPVHVLRAAAGIAKENLAWLAVIRHIAPNQINVRAIGAGWVLRVILHMSAVTVGTLDILSLHVVAFLTSMTVRTKVGAVVSRTVILAAPVSSQYVTVTAAEVGKLGAAVNGAAA